MNIHPSGYLATSCPICKVWEMMPYHKRWSTPMTPQEAEGAMAAGWWAALKAADIEDGQEFRSPLCARHAAIMVVFDSQHEERKRIESQMRTPIVPGHEKQVQEFLARAHALAQPAPSPEPIKPAAVVPTFGVAPPAPMPLPEQPGPMTVMTSPPPVAAMTNPTAPPSAAIFPCPICAKPISSGQVHACEVEESTKPDVKTVK